MTREPRCVVGSGGGCQISDIINKEIGFHAHRFSWEGRRRRCQRLLCWQIMALREKVDQNSELLALTALQSNTSGRGIGNARLCAKIL